MFDSQAILRNSIAKFSYSAFVEEVTKREEAVARDTYVGPGRARELEGALEGLEACRGLPPLVMPMRALIREQSTLLEDLRSSDDLMRFWKQRCKLSAIEWVAQVVSAVLEANHLDVVTTPGIKARVHAAICVRTLLEAKPIQFTPWHQS